MVAITQDDLTRYRSAVTKTLTDQAAVDRTGSVVNCRLSDMQTELHIRRAGELMRMRRFDLRFLVDENIKTGDIVTVSGPGASGTIESRGIYLLYEVGTRTYSGSTLAAAVPLIASAVGSTIRASGAVARGQTSQGSAQVAHLVAWQIFDTMITPVARDFAADAFGTEVQQPSMILVRRPLAGDLAPGAVVQPDFPIGPSDQIILPQGKYDVIATEPFAVGMLAVYIADPYA